MHTVFGIRGIKEKVDKFINELSTRYLAFNRYDSEKKVMKRAGKQDIRDIKIIKHGV